MNGWYAAVKVLINALCFIMGYLVAMVIRVTLFLLVQFFCMLYSICPMNVCTDFEINRYKIDEVRTYAKIAFYLIYLTSCDAKTLRHASWWRRHFSIYILTRNILKPTRSLYDFRFKSYGSNSDFRVFGDLDLDLWPIFYCLSHALRIMYWNIHAKFH